MIIEVSVNDKTYINVVILDRRNQLQCVDSGDLDSRSVFYFYSMMEHSVMSYFCVMFYINNL